MSLKLELKYARSQRELADIVEERDRYIKKYNEARMLLVETQTREESAQCEIQDLRRQLRRYHDDMEIVSSDLNAAIREDDANVLIKQDRNSELLLHSPAMVSRTAFKAISSTLQTEPEPLIVHMSSLPRTPPPTQPPSAHHSPVDVKPSIRRRPYVEIPASSRAPSFTRDVSDGDLLGQRYKLKRTISEPQDPCRSTQRKLSPATDRPITPKNKKDKSTFIPPKELVASLISHVPLFIIDPPPHARCIVTRRLLLEKYGVAPQTFLGHLKPGRTSSLNKRMVALPQKRYNPALPSQPGAHGLLFSMRHHVVGQTVALFVKEGSQALWTYYGEYKGVLCGKVTKQVFIDQADEVKQDWAQKILVQKSDEYLSVKARIRLRKCGQSVTDSNVKNEMDRLKTMPKNRQDLGTRDIIDALVRGDEGLEIIRLECVGFDHSLVEDIRREGLFRDAFEGPLPELTETESGDDQLNFR